MLLCRESLGQKPKRCAYDSQRKDWQRDANLDCGWSISPTNRTLIPNTMLTKHGTKSSFLCFQNDLGILTHILVFLVFVCWKCVCNQFLLGRRLKNLFHRWRYLQTFLSSSSIEWPDSPWTRKSIQELWAWFLATRTGFHQTACTVASGFPELIPHMALRTCNFCVWWCCIKQDFWLRIDFVALHNFPMLLMVWCSTEKSQTVGLINVKPWSCATVNSVSFTASISGLFECCGAQFGGSLFGNSKKSDNVSSHGFIAEKRQTCLPMRSLVPPAIISSIDDWEDPVMVVVCLPFIRVFQITSKILDQFLVHYTINLSWCIW